MISVVVLFAHVDTNANELLFVCLFLSTVLSVLQQESAKRTALEGRLHSQLLMQSETMVAMELKLLKLEAKLERKEAAARAQKSRPTPFRTIDETSYGQIQVQRPPGSRLPPPPRQVSDTEPTNIAVISSGASLASGVTAEGFMEDGADEEHEHSVATGDDATDDVANDGSESSTLHRVTKVVLGVIVLWFSEILNSLTLSFFVSCSSSNSPAVERQPIRKH